MQSQYMAPQFVISPIAIEVSQLPQQSILVHATNCLGTWGSGFALQLKYLFPQAYEKYQTHVNSYRHLPEEHPDKALAGSCYLIEPQAGDARLNNGLELYIACLFTSYGYGRSSASKPGKDSVKVIISQTETSLEQLKQQLADMVKIREIGKVFSPKLNSGSFKTPWKSTEEKIQKVFGRCAERNDDGLIGTWYVMEAPEQVRK